MCVILSVLFVTAVRTAQVVLDAEDMRELYERAAIVRRSSLEPLRQSGVGSDTCEHA
jgi:hypothetical protein